MAAALVFMTVAIVVQRYLLSFSAVRIDAATLDFLTRRLLALPMCYFSARRTGDIQRRLSRRPAGPRVPGAERGGRRSRPSCSWSPRSR